MTTTTLERPRNQTSVGTHHDRVPQATSAAPTYRKTATTVGVIYLRDGLEHDTTATLGARH